MIPYAPLTQKQTDYIRQSQTSWLNVLEGGKRASKNIVNLIAWAVSLDTHPDKLHLAGGVSYNAAKMNIIDSNGFGLKWIYAGRCREGKYLDRDALFIQTKTGPKIVLIAGGGKENDAARIKGFSLGSVYISEINECHETFVKECQTRMLASNRPQFFMDLNPKPPRHWFYVEYLDPHMKKQEQDPNYGVNYAHMTMADNLSMTNEQLRREIGKYDRDSQWFKRDIEGKRTAASGRIYTGYRYKDIAVSAEWIRWIDKDKGIRRQFIDFTVGVDVGGTDATVATLKGFTPRYETAVVIDGYYDKQGSIEHTKTHDIYATEIAAFLLKWTKVYPQLAQSTVFAESADKLFRQALRTALDKVGLHGMMIVPSYKADGILDRIDLMRILINQGRMKIAEHLQPWFEAYENAVWDTKKYADKEWVRVDDGSYPVDCLDSDEYSTQPFKGYLIGA